MEKSGRIATCDQKLLNISTGFFVLTREILSNTDPTETNVLPKKHDIFGMDSEQVQTSFWLRPL